MTLRTLLTATVALTLVHGSAMAANHIVEQSGKKFAPETLKIKAGDTITFVNNDSITHNVYSRTNDHRFNIGAQKSGEKKALKFDKKGLIDIRCAMHPTMKLKVEVE